MPDNASRTDRSRTDTRISPEAVEHDIERDWGRESSKVQFNEELKNAERLPRRGNEEDKPFYDNLGD